MLAVPLIDVILMMSEGSADGGDKKLSTPNENAELVLPENILLTVIVLLDSLTQLIPELRFYVIGMVLTNSSRRSCWRISAGVGR